jgi:hypothetical protein
VTDLVGEYNAMVQEVNSLMGRAVLEPVTSFEDDELGAHRCRELGTSLESRKASDIPPFLWRFPCEGKDASVRDPVEERIKFEVSAVTPDQADRMEADRRFRQWMPKHSGDQRPTRRQFLKEFQAENAKRIAAVSDDDAEGTMNSVSSKKRADSVIRTLVANPRRRGTEAHEYFEAMVGSPTVGEYLAKFPKEAVEGCALADQHGQRGLCQAAGVRGRA